MQRKVKQFIARHYLLKNPDRVIVGLSGGADSVALLHLLVHEGYDCIAAHCNFHLRGEESNRDEEFVKNVCREWNVPLEVIDFKTEEIASDQKISIEMAARDLRYDWFGKLRIKYNADVVAVAHHSDDAAETFLLNLIRGSGIRGLSGMKPRNGYIIRPLLCVTRKEVEDYINLHQLAFVHDSTNSETLYTRNKIRLEILPLLEQINPSVKGSILRTAEYLNDTAEVYFSEIEKQRSAISRFKEGRTLISIHALKDSPFAKTLLFELLNPFGFNSTVCEEVLQALDGLPGKQFFSAGYRLIKDREELIIEKSDHNECGIITIESPDMPLHSSIPLHFEIVSAENFIIPGNKNIACFDAAKITFPLILRPWQTGDRFVPFGMKGSKKLSDYFSDHKFSLVQKEQALVLCSEKKIIWLVGERSDNRFRIDEKTKMILKIEVS